MNNNKNNKYYYNHKKNKYYYKYHNHHNNYYKKKKENVINAQDITNKVNEKLLKQFNDIDYNVNNQDEMYGSRDYGYTLEEPKLIKKDKKANSLSFIKILKYAFAPLLLIIVLVGTSYAFFNYYKESTNQADVIAGDVYVTIQENPTPTLTITKAYPRTNEEARARTDNYVDFTILGKNTSGTKELVYNLVIANEANDNNKILINSQYLRFDLYSLDTNNNPTTILSAVTLNGLNTAKVRDFVIPVNTTSEIAKKYRLRVWVSDEVVISDTEIGATYTQEQFNKLYANITISVNATDRTPVPTGAEYIASIASQKSYIQSYASSNPTFTTQDTVGTNNNKETVYYFTGSDAAANSNVLFAGYCWQIVRTTDTGGVKLVYNGVAQNNQCKTNRSETTWKGINATVSSQSYSLSGVTAFGRSFDYDLQAGTFTITDTTGLPTGWSENDTNNNSTPDYQELIGTWTCKNAATTTCSTIYYVGHYYSATNASLASYAIGDVAHFSQIGTSSFNAYSDSPALVGYMYNTVYRYAGNSTTSGAIYGKDVEWDGENYLVIEATEHVASTNTTKDDNHHYSCGTNGGTSCSTVRYYYYNNYYINLTSGKTIETALKEMINYGSGADAEINRYDSAIKGIIDNWYAKNMTAYTSYLDNSAVYCNDRSVTSTTNLGGWLKTGSITYELKFKQYTNNTDLACTNVTDRFSVNNTIARLSYPVGLLTEPEKELMGTSFAVTEQVWWLSAPYGFNDNYAIGRLVNAAGSNSANNIVNNRGARPAVTLNSAVEFEDGDGGYETPFVVGPLVTRTTVY